MLEQQQKLCIARLLPLKPDVLLMDERKWDLLDWSGFVGNVITIFRHPHIAFIVAVPTLSCQNTLRKSRLMFMSTMMKS